MSTPIDLRSFVVCTLPVAMVILMLHCSDQTIDFNALIEIKKSSFYCILLIF